MKTEKWNVFCHLWKVKYLFGLILLFSFPLHGQNYLRDHFGLSAGIALNFGSHINGIGLKFNGYYTDYFYQINAGQQVNFYFQHIGTRKKFIESKSNLGLVFIFGKENNPIDIELDGLNHQTKHDFGLGYNYIFYRDNAGTSQNSGGFAFHFKNLSLYHENDFFAGQAKDRFRTAHFYLSWKEDTYKVGSGVYIWTGETSGAIRSRIQTKESPHGFKILEDLPYGKTSHGIAYASALFSLPYTQTIHLRLGVDGERIRHIIQNKIAHDIAFIPGLSQKMKRTTPHYPMLNEEGCPVFDIENRRKNNFFFSFGANKSWSDF